MSRVSITVDLEPEDGVGTHAWVRMKREDSDVMGEAWIDGYDEDACLACALHYLINGLKGDT